MTTTQSAELGELAEGWPTATSPVSTLDRALDRVSALDFAIPNPFVNHAPMACEALAVLGFHSLIADWVRRFESSMGTAVAPVTPDWRSNFDWKGRLGDHRLLPQWMGYFGRAIADEGWSTVVEVWVPRLMPGLAAALFHGAIRTSHAVRAIGVADTPARRAELARALGNWAVWFGPGEAADDVAVVGDLRSAAVDAAAMGARFYAAAPTIVNLHGVTGAMAVHLLTEHVPASGAELAVTQLRAEHRSLYRGVTAATGDNDDHLWDKGAAVAAAASFDPHQIKLVEASWRGFEACGDPAFVTAARTVTARRLIATN